MAKVFSPTQLEHELVLNIERVLRGHIGQNLGQAEQAMGDVGR